MQCEDSLRTKSRLDKYHLPPIITARVSPPTSLTDLPSEQELRRQIDESKRTLKKLVSTVHFHQSIVTSAIEEEQKATRQATETRERLKKLFHEKRMLRAASALKRAEESKARALAVEKQLRLRATAASEGAIGAVEKYERRLSRVAQLASITQTPPPTPSAQPYREEFKGKLSEATVLARWGQRVLERRKLEKERLATAAEWKREVERRALAAFLAMLPATHTKEFADNFRREFTLIENDAAARGIAITERAILDQAGDTHFDQLANLAIQKDPGLYEPENLGSLHATMAGILYTTDFGYKAINPMLRSKTHYGSSFMIKALSEYMQDHATSEITLVRSTDLPPSVLSTLQDTDLLGDSAFVSAAVLESGVPAPFRKAKDRLIILQGRGTDVRPVSTYPEEAEILLPPGTTFKVICSWSYWGHAFDEQGNQLLGKPVFARNAEGEILYDGLRPKLKRTDVGEYEYYPDHSQGEVIDGVEVIVPKKTRRTLRFVKQL